MRSLSIVLPLLLATSCNAPSTDNATTPPATETNEVTANSADADADNAADAELEKLVEAGKIAPYTVAADGSRWLYGRNPKGEPFATYGLPDAQMPDLWLQCAPSGLTFSLDGIDPDTVRERAILTSGAARFEKPAEPKDSHSLGEFVVPFADPLLAAMPLTGLTVTPRGGEKKKYPGGPVVARIINECSKRGAAG